MTYLTRFFMDIKCFIEANIVYKSKLRENFNRNDVKSMIYLP